ncbi:hypothetical protein FBU30_005334 [Linnemannia zychae]|nr:hypothetical protein FBU30_005334 [Linnemannia zychae]
MSPAIQDGRYKIWRSPEKHQFIVSMHGPDSMAVLSSSTPDDNQSGERGIWTVTSASHSAPSISGADAVTATLQEETTQAYLAIDDPSDLGRGANVYVKKDDKQVWTLNPASTTDEELKEGGEYHIGFPDLVDGQVLVVDNSFARAFPPRLALQPLSADIPSIGGPWYFEPIA